MDTDGKLWPLAKCLFATLLMHLQEMRSRYPRHDVLPILLDKANDCGITLKDLLQWGKMVKERFTESNMIATLQTGETLIPILLEKIVVLDKTISSQQEVNN